MGIKLIFFNFWAKKHQFYPLPPSKLELETLPGANILQNGNGKAAHRVEMLHDEHGKATHRVKIVACLLLWEYILGFF